MSGQPGLLPVSRGDSLDSADSGDGQKGSRSPGAVSEDFGCGSELAQCDLHQDHEIAMLSDNDGALGDGNLLNALRARGGRPKDVAAPFTALHFPLLQLGDEDLQSTTEATLNLLNNLLGSAIMVMPRAFANVGIVNGIILLVAMVAANRFTLLSVLRMSLTTLDQEPSYPEIGKAVMGQQGLLAVLISYILLTGGCLIGMTIALADVLHQLVDYNGPRTLWVVASVLLCTPGAMLKTLKNIAVLSGICMLGVVTIVTLLTVVCLGDVLVPQKLTGVVLEEGATTTPAVVEDVDNHIHLFIADPHGIFVTMSLFAFQFSVQAGGIEVLTRLRPEDASNGADSDGGDDSHGSAAADRITMLAYVLAALMSGACGLAGYMRFGNKVMGNILLNFGHDDHPWSMLLIRIAYVFVITCSFAFIIVPCRYAAYDLFGMRRRNVASDNSETISAKTFRRTTFAILAICLFVATFVSDLAAMFNYVGVWATMAIGFILPCAFQIELRRRQEGIEYNSSKNATSVLLIFVGVGIIVGNSCLWISEFLEPPSPAASTVVLTSTPAPVAPAGSISQ